MAKKKPKLPDWASFGPDVVTRTGKTKRVIVDMDKAYPAMLDELGVEKSKVDQYWLEVAYQCIKLDVQKAMGGFGFNIDMVGTKERWRLSNFAPGRGVAAATKGKEARDHYIRLRGGLPV